MHEQKHGVNTKLLLITLVVVPLLAAGAYAIHELQMPRLAGVFLRRASEEESLAEEAEEAPAIRQLHLQNAASQLFRYMQLVGRRPSVEMRLAKLWDQSAAPDSLNALVRNVELHYQAIGSNADDPAVAEDVAELRVRLLELLERLGRFAEVQSLATDLLAFSADISTENGAKQFVSPSIIRTAANETSAECSMYANFASARGTGRSIALRSDKQKKGPIALKMGVRSYRS